MFEKRIKLYQTLLENEAELYSIKKEKEKILDQKSDELELVNQNCAKVKHEKNLQTEVLARLKKELK